jgi:hypothetical protein
MLFKVEVLSDELKGGEKSLRLSWGLEAAHSPLP